MSSPTSNITRSSNPAKNPRRKKFPSGMAAQGCVFFAGSNASAKAMPWVADTTSVSSEKSLLIPATASSSNLTFLAIALCDDSTSFRFSPCDVFVGYFYRIKIKRRKIRNALTHRDHLQGGVGIEFAELAGRLAAYEVDHIIDQPQLFAS